MDEDDEEDEEGEEQEGKDLEDDSLEGPLSRSNRPSRGGMKPALMEESDNDFWGKSTHTYVFETILYSISNLTI